MKIRRFRAAGIYRYLLKKHEVIKLGYWRQVRPRMEPWRLVKIEKTVKPHSPFNSCSGAFNHVILP